jgi:radical SAM protein with 4Fe4S-binding SPASM domain
MYIDPQHFLDVYLPAKEYAKTKNIGLSTPLEIASMPQNAFCSAVGGTLFTPSGLLSSCTRVTRSDHELADTYIYGKFNPVTLEYDIDKEKFSNLQNLRNVPEECEKCPALNLCGGATCYLERGPSHCYVRSRLLLIERLKLGGLA